MKEIHHSPLSLPASQSVPPSLAHSLSHCDSLARAPSPALSPCLSVSMCLSPSLALTAPVFVHVDLVLARSQLPCSLSMLPSSTSCSHLTFFSLLLPHSPRTRFSARSHTYGPTCSIVFPTILCVPQKGQMKETIKGVDLPKIMKTLDNI